jgi:hypothetical protein
LNWKRSAFHSRSQFGSHSVFSSVNALHAEVRRMGGRDVIVSTNLRVRADGLPYSNQRQPEDPGVAVYFIWKQKPIVFACDRWKTVEENLWAIVKHIESLRGQERWGVGSLDQAFAGYAALPAAGQTSGESWWTVLGVPVNATVDVAQEAFRALAKQHHPDRGGEPAQFLRITKAWNQAQEDLLR